MSDKKIYGKVTYDSDIEYEWMTEPGACEKCRALDGKRFQHSDEIPDRPHPNCKCWIKVHMTYKDPLKNLRETRIKARHEREKLEGDIRTLVEEIDANIEYLEMLLASLYNYEKLYIHLSENDILDVENKKVIISNVIIELQKYKRQITTADYKMTTSIKPEFFNNIITTIGHLVKFDKSLGLWNIAYSNFSGSIQKNSLFLGNVKYINDQDLRQKIIKKLKSQNMPPDSRGIYFYSNSMISKKIIQTPALKKCLSSNISNIKYNTKIPKTSLEFSNFITDEFWAFHKIDIVDIHIDNTGTLRGKIIDTYDFNPNEMNPFVILGKKYQDNQSIESFFIIIDIEINDKDLKKMLK